MSVTHADTIYVTPYYATLVYVKSTLFGASKFRCYYMYLRAILKCIRKVFNLASGEEILRCATLEKKEAKFKVKQGQGNGS